MPGHSICTLILWSSLSTSFNVCRYYETLRLRCAQLASPAKRQHQHLVGAQVTGQLNQCIMPERKFTMTNGCVRRLSTDCVSIPGGQHHMPAARHLSLRKSYSYVEPRRHSQVRFWKPVGVHIKAIVSVSLVELNEMSFLCCYLFPSPPVYRVYSVYR